MKRFGWLLVILVLLFGLSIWLGRNPQKPAPSQIGAPAPQKQVQVQPSFELVLVTRVIDGDTIEVEFPSGKEKVRYIGIDTPELRDRRPTVKLLAKEATAQNKKLVLGKKVELVKDISDRDRYHRLLRYVFLEDGTFVNLELVRQGFAQVATYPPDIKYQELFLAAQQEARRQNLGLWSQTP